MNTTFNTIKKLSRNDDISNLFRKSAENMEVRPSSGARLRFEQRLGSRRQYRQSNLHKYMIMIAAVVACLCVISIFTIYNPNGNSPGVADNKTDAPTIGMGNDSEKIAEAKKQHKLELAEELEELNAGEDVKKVLLLGEAEIEDEALVESEPKEVAIAKPIKPEDKTTESNTTAKPGNANIIKRTSVTPKEEVKVREEMRPAPKPAPKAKAKPVQKPKVFKPMIADAGDSKKEKNAMPNKKDEAISPRTAPTVSAPIPSSEYAVAEKESAGVEMDDVALESVQAKTKSSRKEKKRERKNRAKKNANNSSAGGSNPQSVQNFAKIKPFNWLVGKWKDEANSKTTVEEWKKVGPSELQGKGYVMIDGQETFREDLSIKLMGDDVYYIMALDQKNAKVYFKLKSYKNNRATFENDGDSFPNQVIIEKHSNKNFSTTLQNNNVQFKNEQQQYLMHRNAVMDQKAKRNMTRSSNK